MKAVAWHESARAASSRRVLALVCAGLLACAPSWAADAADATAGKSTPAVADRPGSAQDILNYLISSGALSLEDAQKLVERLRAEEQKKNADNLLNYLVESKSLSAEDAQKALNDMRGGKSPAGKTEADAKPAAPAATPAPVPAAPEPPANRLHAVYLPDSERARIRDEIRQDVMETARRENWAQPDTVPEWVRHVHLNGEFLLRGEVDTLDRDNDPALNFQAINSGSPVDVFLPSTGTPQKVLTIPFLNTTESRAAPKIRVRLALQADVSDRVDTGLRLATGSTTNPASQTQTLGTDLNKVPFLLDRAWLRYRAASPLTFTGGRMASPWVAPTELVWDKDLGFDGFAMQYRPSDARHLNGFVTLGAFSLENTDSNYPSQSPFKVASRDKWLLGIQIGGSRETASGFGFRVGLGLYDFNHIQGVLSSSCYAPTAGVPCDTDYTRPGYSQKGNTMFALRLLNRPTPATDPEFQYFGLASPFLVRTVDIGIDMPVSGPTHAQLDLALARNLDFSSDDIIAHNPVNNFSTCPASSPNCSPSWVGGGSAWVTQLRIGRPRIAEAGEWNTLFGYRYVESDAVVDAFTDSDFHLGGTNAKGIYLGGNVGLGHNVWVGAKYMSAREVAGWKFSADVLQVDLNARF